MKDFFKNVLATIVGLFAFGIICTVLCVMSLIGMIA
jgi:protease-4